MDNRISIPLATGFTLLIPFIADSAIVPCSGLECQACHFVTLGDRIVDFIVAVMAILGGIALAWAGVLMVSAAGNESQIGRGKKILWSVIVGFIIVLAAWLLIDLIMKSFVNDGSFGRPWDNIQCVSQPQFREGPERGAPSNVTINPGTASGNLMTYAGYQFDDNVVDEMQHIAENFNLTVTSGYRDPQHNASVGGVPTSYHLTGRAGDFTGSQSDMQAAKAWAEANGAIEALIHNVGSGVHLHVAF